LLAIDRYQVKSNKVILISAFSDVAFIIKIFADMFALRQSTIDAMKQIALKRFANTYETPWNWEDISPLQTVKCFDGELLFIHDDQDHEVPLSEAIPLNQSVTTAKILITSGYGHRKILMNKEVIDATLRFIKH
jgi:hypothetical protein